MHASYSILTHIHNKTQKKRCNLKKRIGGDMKQLQRKGKETLDRLTTELSGSSSDNNIIYLRTGLLFGLFLVSWARTSSTNCLL